MNLKTLLVLRSRRFDLAINMRTLVGAAGALKMRLVLAFISPALSAGRDTEGRGAFFDISVDETDAGDKYEMEYDIELVGKLAATVSDRKIDYIVSEKSYMAVADILEAHTISGKDILVGIHPGGEPSRRWPVENFAKTIKEIAGKVECSFVITGSLEERPLADALARLAAAKTINMAGDLTIEELGAMIKRCDLFISNDTAAMHIAALLKTPIVAIFGPGSLTRFDPRHISDKAVVMYKKAACAPCNKWTCKDMRCLKGILPEEVADEALRLLGKNKGIIVKR